MRTLIDHIPNEIYVRDFSNRFILANASFARLMGVAGPSALIGKKDADFYPAELAADYDSIDQGVFAGRESINEERLLHFPNGQELVMLTTKVPFRNEKGEVIGLIGVGHDITERKRAEEALRYSQALYQSLLSQMPAGIFRKDREGRFVAVNPVFCQLKGLSMEEILGKTPKELDDYERAKEAAGLLKHPPRQRPLVAQGTDHHQRIMRTGETIELEEVYPQPDGTVGIFSRGQNAGL